VPFVAHEVLCALLDLVRPGSHVIATLGWPRTL